MAPTPIGQLVKLKSPFNGEVFVMEFVPGVPPTLDAMLLAKFTRVDDAPTKKARKEDRT